MSERDALVVGYGNSLRTDDGVGWQAAQTLATDPRMDGVEVLARHQLTLELAEDLSRTSLAVLIDAHEDHIRPGSVRTYRVQSRGGAPTPVWSHHLDPAALVDFTAELYRRVPPVFVVEVGAASFDDGDRLSPAVREALPVVVDAVVALVEQYRA